jgi:hypothetical protein
MQIDPNAFGHGAASTVLHPVVIVAMIVTIILMLVLPRKYVVVPFILCVFLTPVGQQLYIGGMHFFVLRILVLFACLRIIFAKIASKTEIAAGGFNVVDKLFLGWIIFRTVSPVIGFQFDPGAVIYQVGFLWDTLGGYMMMRFFVRDKEDVSRLIKAFAAVVVILGLTMANEKLRNQNVFGYLGSVSIIPGTREGTIRASGPFAVSILAGTFAATLIPLFLWLWNTGKSKTTAVLGLIGSTIMVSCSSSSTPLLAYVAAIAGICMWPMRKKMRIVRLGVVAALIALHLVMKAPVWFLIARVDLIAGNSGYHRAMLVDSFIRHFSDWWLIGTNQAMSWGYEMEDMSNQFVAEGETGGLAGFICFVLLVSRSFGRLGDSRKIVDGDRREEWFVWLLGVALFSHCVAYFGISYFDQTRISWLALLAIISAITAPILATKVVESETPLPLRLPVKPKLTLPVPVANSSTGARKSERTLSRK